MRRRELMLLLGGALTATGALRAQQKAIPVIGFLGSPGPLFLAPFRQGLSETCYVEGQNVAIESRGGRKAAMIGCPHWRPISSAAKST